MPVATPTQYIKMLQKAQQKAYAYPAINVTSTSTANAALMGLAQESSDGILQVSTGGGEFAGGGNRVNGAISLAGHIHTVADQYDILVAIHTDHCPPNKVESFLLPLIEKTSEWRKKGSGNLFQSHMFDGSELPLKENLSLARELLQRCKEQEIILEVETGIVGGEEDGVNNENLPSEKLYTTPQEMVEVAQALLPLGKFMYAATFGNVHGVYRPGNVKLRPEILKLGQEAVEKELGKEALHWLVFHGGSGSELAEIRQTLEYGVIKMNIDTDTQYAYSRGAADHFFKNYDQVMKLDGGVGNKKFYDPRSWMKKAQESMANRVARACVDLRSQNQTLFSKNL